MLAYGIPRLYARDAEDCLECRYTQINFANAQQPAWEISRIRTRWYLVRVGVQLPGITAKINDLLPARKLTTFLLYPLFFLHIRKLHKFDREISTRQILSTTCYISIRSQILDLNKHMWKLSYHIHHFLRFLCDCTCEIIVEKVNRRGWLVVVCNDRRFAMEAAAELGLCNLALYERSPVITSRSGNKAWIFKDTNRRKSRSQKIYDIISAISFNFLLLLCNF